MRKSLLTLAASALAVSLQAQTLPSPVYSIDFEGVSSAQDLGAELVGAGLFLQSEDQNFGTYYQNNPEGVIASHQNYLIIPTAAFADCQAKSNEQFSIAFWMNGYVANEKQGTDANGHYFLRQLLLTARQTATRLSRGRCFLPVHAARCKSTATAGLTIRRKRT